MCDYKTKYEALAAELVDDHGWHRCAGCGDAIVEGVFVLKREHDEPLHFCVATDACDKAWRKAHQAAEDAYWHGMNVQTLRDAEDRDAIQSTRGVFPRF